MLNFILFLVRVISVFYSYRMNKNGRKHYNVPKNRYILNKVFRRKFPSCFYYYPTFSSLFLFLFTFILILSFSHESNGIEMESHKHEFNYNTEIELSNIKLLILQKLKNISRSRENFFLSLLLAGDIELNPGPGVHTTKCVCPGCLRTVAKNHRAVNCDLCLKWYHIKCENISPKQYNDFVRKSDINELFFTCSACHLESLPFPEGYFELSSEDSDFTPQENLNFVENSEYNFKNLNSRKGLSISLLNVNGLRSKLDDIKILLQSGNIDILCVNETKVDQHISQADLAISGYNLHRKDRNRHGGGVGIYCKDFININTLPHLSSEGIESIWIKISVKKSSPIFLCCAYRPPRKGQDKEKIEHLISHFKNTISNLPSKSEVFILGDLNCDYNNNKHALSSIIKNFCTSYHFKQLISVNTRVTDSSSTLLDLILTNSRHVSFSGVDNIGISDHCLVFAERKLTKYRFGAKTVTTRSFKHFSVDNFLADLEKCDWNPVINNDDLDSACENFNNTLLSVTDKHAPLKTHRVRNNQEAWIDDNFLFEIRQRDYLKKTASMTNNANDWDAFKKKRNYCNRLKKHQKSQHFSKILSDNKSNGKKLWKHIRNLLPKNCSENITSLKGENNETQTESKVMANTFNYYFKTVGAKLASKFPPGRSDQINIPINQSNFSFKHVSPDTVSKIISSLENNKATGMDGISVKILKSGSPLLSHILSFLFNNSMLLGRVPKCWKTKRISPLFKEGDPGECNNYRPISILPIVMKVFEKIVEHQVSEFIDSHNLITNFQSGFRKKHSTDTAVLEVTDFIFNELDKGKHVGAVLIDFKKAFDTVDHTILLKKLYCMGFRDTSFDWIQSYLRL